MCNVISTLYVLNNLILPTVYYTVPTDGETEESHGRIIILCQKWNSDQVLWHKYPLNYTY